MSDNVDRFERNDYVTLAYDYAEAVKNLFSPVEVSASDRSGAGFSSSDELATQAEKICPISAELTRAAAALLTSEDVRIRVQASERLLAKSIADLQVCAHLFQAWENEKVAEVVVGVETADVERGSVGVGFVQDCLNILTGKSDASAGAERSVSAPANVALARAELSARIDDVLGLVRDRAGESAQAAVNGVLSLGVVDLAETLGLLGMDVAKVLGQGEHVARLYGLFREFAIRSYESLLALLGPQLARAAVSEAIQWVGDIRKGRIFRDLLEVLYQTEKTSRELSPLVNETRADLQKFQSALDGLDDLTQEYGRQIEIADKLIKCLRFLRGIPAATLPNGQLVLAAAYMLVGAYVTTARADYVDAPHFRFLNRTYGVRKIVQVSLGPAAKAA